MSIRTRFKKGYKLTAEQRKEVLKTLQDAYVVNERPYSIEEYPSADGGYVAKRRVWLDRANDYMEVSEVTGRLVRWFIRLPDGTLAHPTEVYPSMSIEQVEAHANSLDNLANQRLAATERTIAFLRENNLVGPLSDWWVGMQPYGVRIADDMGDGLLTILTWPRGPGVHAPRRFWYKHFDSIMEDSSLTPLYDKKAGPGVYPRWLTDASLPNVLSALIPDVYQPGGTTSIRADKATDLMSSQMPESMPVPLPKKGKGKAVADTTQEMIRYLRERKQEPALAEWWQKIGPYKVNLVASGTGIVNLLEWPKRRDLLNNLEPWYAHFELFANDSDVFPVKHGTRWQRIYPDWVVNASLPDVLSTLIAGVYQPNQAAPSPTARATALAIALAEQKILAYQLKFL